MPAEPEGRLDGCYQVRPEPVEERKKFAEAAALVAIQRAHGKRSRQRCGNFVISLAVSLS